MFFILYIWVMKQIGFTGKWSNETKSIKVNVPVMLFKEDNIFIAYVPVLDISGYGESEDDAKESLNISLDHYFTYTHNKNTLAADLIMHGWVIKRKTKPYIAPEISTLLTKNPYLKDIFDSRKYTMDRMDLSIPQHATC